MFIIESGQIEIVRKSRPDEALATLGPGDFFGEMAMLEDQPRFATATARTNARVLRIERAAFAEVLRQNVEIAVRIMRKLAARQRRTDQRLLEVTNELARVKGAPAAAARPATPPPKVAPAPPPPPPPPPPPQQFGLRHVASGQVLLLEPERSEFLVGRPDPVTGTQPEINLGPFDVNRTLSRRHAKILKEGGLYSVREEVGTTNGTFVNGERIKTGAGVALKPRDRLRFGSIEVELVTV
jgi:hypothetical protein